MTNKNIHEHPNRSLVNYLRAHRRKTGFTQDEVSRVVGHGTHGTVSHHERFGSAPPLFVALSYEALYRVPVSELFAGLTEIVESSVESQIDEFERSLGEQSASGPRAAAIARKLEWLSERRISGYK